MKIVAPIAAGLALVTLAACDDPGSSASSGAPSTGGAFDLASFQGARAGQAEMGIKSLGYEPTRTEGLTAFWYNPTTDVCARITTSDGRYSEVVQVPAADC